MSDTGGGFGSSGWQIAEHDSFEESVLQAGGHLEVDEGLAWVDEALNKNPPRFPTSAQRFRRPFREDQAANQGQ